MDLLGKIFICGLISVGFVTVACVGIVGGSLALCGVSLIGQLLAGG